MLNDGQKAQLKQLHEAVELVMQTVNSDDGYEAVGILLEGRCRKCGGKLDGGRCWTCYESRGE